MYKFLLSLYVATVIAAITAFILNYMRIGKYARSQGMQPVFNADSLICLLMCFIPVINVTYGNLYWEGFLMSDDDIDKYMDEEE